MKLLHFLQGLFHTLTFPSSGAKSITAVAQQLPGPVQGNCYRVRHIDGQQVPRVLVISAPDRKMAQAFAEQLYGDYWYLSAVRV